MFLLQISDYHHLNELVQRSTRYVFYDFITKYTDIFFVEKNVRSFCNAKASHIFIYEIFKFEILTKR